MHKFLFYNKFILFLYMFRALRAHRQEVELCYTASGNVTPVGGFFFFNLLHFPLLAVILHALFHIYSY